MKNGFTIIAIILVFMASSKYAFSKMSPSKDLSQRYCEPFLQNITDVVVSIKNSNFISQHDQTNILNNIKKRFYDFLANENINLKLIHNPEGANINEDGALYVQLVYATADRDAFTENIDKDLLATWLNVSRIFENQNNNKSIRTKINFVLFDAEKKNLITLNSSYHGLFESVLCGVLSGTVNKQCTNPKDFLKNELIPFTQKCIVRK